MAGFTISVQCI